MLRIHEYTIKIIIIFTRTSDTTSTYRINSDVYLQAPSAEKIVSRSMCDVRARPVALVELESDCDTDSESELVGT